MRFNYLTFATCTIIMLFVAGRGGLVLATSLEPRIKAAKQSTPLNAENRHMAWDKVTRPKAHPGTFKKLAGTTSTRVSQIKAKPPTLQMGSLKLGH